MGLRAVVFDYGMVLSGPQDPEAHAVLQRITGLPPDRFEALYWADRPAYDEGQLDGVSYWRKFAGDAGISLSPSAIEELIHWDVLLWTTENPAMVAWAEQVKQRGLLTAILSNMGDTVLANIEREFAWLQRFDVLVWSFQVGMVKPNPAVYRHLLKELGTRPEETLFLDDRRINVEAARALGMRAIEYSTVERLRADLIAAGLEGELPLPC